MALFLSFVAAIIVADATPVFLRSLMLFLYTAVMFTVAKWSLFYISTANWTTVTDGTMRFTVLLPGMQ